MLKLDATDSLASPDAFCVASLSDGPSDGSNEAILLDQMAGELGATDPSRRASLLADHYLMPLFEPPAGMPIPVDPRVRDLLPAEFCRRHWLAPLAADALTIEIAIAEPDALTLADAVAQLCGRKMRPLFARPAVIEQTLTQLFGCDTKVDPACPVPRRFVSLTDFHLDEAERAICQEHLSMSRGLTLISGGPDTDMRPLSVAWCHWTQKLHEEPIFVWHPDRPITLGVKTGLIWIPELNSDAGVRFCLHRVLEGYRVLAAMRARDAAAAILRLRAWGSLGSALAQQISLMIHFNTSQHDRYGVYPVNDSLRKRLSHCDCAADLNRCLHSTRKSVCGL